MLKKVRFDKSDIGDCFCMSVPVEANSKEQALNRFVRYCKMSKDIKYLGDIVFMPKGRTCKNVIVYGEYWYEFLKIKRPYQTEFEIYITQIPTFLYTNSEGNITFEKLSKCPYKITNPLGIAENEKTMHFPTIEMAKVALTKLEEEVKRSNLKDKTIRHNIPI